MFGLPQKRHLPLAWFSDLFTHSSTKKHLWNLHTLKNPSISNCLIRNKCIEGVLTYWFQDRNSLEKLNVLHEVKHLPSLHSCVLDETSCPSMFGDVSESLWLDRGLSCAPCRSAGWSSCDPCCYPTGSAMQPSWWHAVWRPSVRRPARSLVGSRWLGLGWASVDLPQRPLWSTK